MLSTQSLTEQDILAALRDVYDPELPVNIVDLGLVYNVEIKGGAITVEMTLTAPGCSMGAMIASEIQDKLLGIPGCEEANVEMVWDPPWTPHMMSPAARKTLGLDDD